MPEPLSKVLEPSVSVTYLDQSQSSDADEFLRASKYLEPVINEDDEEAAATEEEPQKDQPPAKQHSNDGPLIYKLQKTGSEPQGNFLEINLKQGYTLATLIILKTQCYSYNEGSIVIKLHSE